MREAINILKATTIEMFEAAETADQALKSIQVVPPAPAPAPSSPRLRPLEKVLSGLRLVFDNRDGLGQQTTVMIKKAKKMKIDESVKEDLDRAAKRFKKDQETLAHSTWAKWRRGIWVDELVATDEEEESIASFYCLLHLSDPCHRFSFDDLPFHLRNSKSFLQSFFHILQPSRFFLV